MSGVTILGIIVIGVIALVVVVAWINEQRIRGELRQQGVTIQAKVTDRHHEHSTNTNSNGSISTSDHYYISYRYTVDGKSYYNRESVGFGTYEALAQDAPVEVIYMPGKPNEVRLASDL